MEFCLECQNFIEKNGFVKHVKQEHGFKTKAAYLEKWRGAKEKDEQGTPLVGKEILTEESVAAARELTDEEFERYFALNNDLNALRMEIGRTFQILTVITAQTNEIEKQFVELKQGVARRLGLEDLSWRVDQNTKEVI